MEYNQDQPDKAAAIAKAQLAKNPDLKGIFATNLFGAEGSATGLREAGKQDTVKIVGFDAGPKQVKDLEDGPAPGARRPEAGRHRRAGRPAGRRRAQGRADQGEDRHRLRDPHQGQPGREPGLRLQVQLLNAGRSPARPPGWAGELSAALKNSNANGPTAHEGCRLLRSPRVRGRGPPATDPGPQDVRITVHQTGLCGTDKHIHEGDFNAAFPLVPGHEIVGTVESTGDEVAGSSRASG